MRWLETQNKHGISGCHKNTNDWGNNGASNQIHPFESQVN